MFSSEDVCRIIAECKLSGVAEITVEGVHLKFWQAKETEQPATELKPPLKISAIDHDKQSREFLEEEELLLREERLATMLLEDPAEFERQLASGELDEELIEDDRGPEYDDGTDEAARY